MLPEQTLNKARSLFPFTARGKIYLNHAATSPLSTRVIEALAHHLRDRSEGAIETFADDLDTIAECRELVQEIINAESPDRIAFLPNTSDALNVIAAGLPWKTGDRVLLNDLEFPANVYPYVNLKHLGVELDIISTRDNRLTPEMIEHAITSRTRLLALSAVQFLTGHRADLESIGELCRSRGIIFAVDAIQAVGAVRIDVRQMKIDAAAAGGQKWQMAPHGTGFLYLTEHLQSLLQQKHLGWLSVSDPWDFHTFTQPLAASARRYEGGSPNVPGLYGYRAALAQLLDFDIRSIEDHILDLTDALIAGLSAIPGVVLRTPRARGEHAGIVTIQLPPAVDENRVFAQIAATDVVISLREGMLRFSPHFYNTKEEIARAIDITQYSIAQP